MEPFSVERPWGNFRQFTHNENSTVKIITVKAGEEFSLQKHSHRDEFWRILEGKPKVVVGGKNFQANKGDEFLVPKGVEHRVSAGDSDVVFLEIALGDFKEDDIVRLEDKYGRI